FFFFLSRLFLLLSSSDFPFPFFLFSFSITANSYGGYLFLVFFLRFSFQLQQYCNITKRFFWAAGNLSYSYYAT
ncbi:hypothetical protein DFH27DRAFT_569113, partial [Peziza echinospora]